MPVATIDTAAARAYEDHLVGPLFAPWARRVAALAVPVAGETVLDVACGTGIGARLVAPRLSPGGRVISADIDPAIVAVGEAVAQAAAIPGDVALEWHAVAAETKLVADGSIDLCLCLQGPQFLADPPAAMALIAAALRPGGRLAASMWNEYSTNKGHHAIGQALLARGMKPALKPFSMGDPAEARRLVEDAGLVVERFETGGETVAFASARAFVEGVAAGAPATRHALAQLSPGELDGFIADVDRLLVPYRVEDGLALPTSAHMVLARKPV